MTRTHAPDLAALAVLQEGHDIPNTGRKVNSLLQKKGLPRTSIIPAELQGHTWREVGANKQ